MAAKRGRAISNMGYHLFAGTAGGYAPPAGQPVMIRMQGVPTMPGYRDRPGKWNFLIPPFLVMIIKELIERLRT